MTVIAIGLDSAEPALIEKWIAEGDLPNLAKLKDQGVYGRLDNFDMYSAELPWTTFATGVMPEHTGYWTPLTYSPDYTINTRAAYEFDEFPAFFSLGENYRVCSFDIPQVRLQNNLNGWQFNAWGAHSPQIKAESNVPEIFQEIIDKHGCHPGLHKDYAMALDLKGSSAVYQMLMEGVERRAKICADLVKREPWDLFITVFGEPHGGGHNFWQFQPDHPLYNEPLANRELLPENPLKNIYAAIDKGIGEIVAAAPKDSKFMIFSAHGMGPNTMDLPSTFFLPELLYRYSFGRSALGDVTQSKGTMSKPITKMTWGTWERDVWNTIQQGNWAIKLARKYLPTRLYRPLAKRFEFSRPDYPMGPIEAQARLPGKPNFQPTLWYSNVWPKMKAFALPSFSEGYIRINVEGREKNGIVKANEYLETVKEICEQLKHLKCARTGAPMVSRIETTRQDAFDDNPKLPNADIIIAWQDQFATDAVEHPNLGIIGPVPHYRSGSHRHTGFMIAKGQEIAAGSHLIDAHALDIGPTILSLLGAHIPSYMAGKDCLAGIQSNQVTRMMTIEERAHIATNHNPQLAANSA